MSHSAAPLWPRSAWSRSALGVYASSFPCLLRWFLASLFAVSALSMALFASATMSPSSADVSNRRRLGRHLRLPVRVPCLPARNAQARPSAACNRLREQRSIWTSFFLFFSFWQRKRKKKIKNKINKQNRHPRRVPCFGTFTFFFSSHLNHCFLHPHLCKFTGCCWSRRLQCSAGLPKQLGEHCQHDNDMSLHVPSICFSATLRLGDFSVLPTWAPDP